MAPDPKSALHRFYMLDLFRFIAATCVMIGHTSYHTKLPGFDRTYLAVDFFFILSGFILSWRYYDVPRGQFDYKNYVIARFTRLWPLNLFTLLLAVLAIRYGTMVMNPPNPDTSLKTFLLNFFFLQGAGLGAEASFDIPSWSVSSEFWVNLVFPVLFLRFWPVAFVISIGVYSYFIHHGASLDLWGPPDHGPAGIDLLRCFAGFACGVATYYAYKWSSKTADQWTRYSGSAMELLVIILGVLCVSFCPGSRPLSFWAIPFFMLVVFAFGHQKGFISFAVRPVRRMAVFLGGISYAVYLLHVPVANGLKLNSNDPQQLGKYVAAVIIAASLTWLLVEKPAKKGLNALLKRP